MGATQASCVLVVDDHADTLHSLVKLLTRNGYSTLSAATFHDALDLAARGRCCVVIADISLPDGSGLDLMRQLATQGTTGIAISGHAAYEYGQAALEAGFSAYLEKPIRFVDLLTTLARLTDGPKPPPGHRPS